MEEKPPLGTRIRVFLCMGISYFSFIIAVSLPVYILMLLIADTESSGKDVALIYLVIVDLLAWVLGIVFAKLSRE